MAKAGAAHNLLITCAAWPHAALPLIPLHTGLVRHVSGVLRQRQLRQRSLHWHGASPQAQGKIRTWWVRHTTGSAASDSFLAPSSFRVSACCKAPTHARSSLLLMQLFMLARAHTQSSVHRRLPSAPGRWSSPPSSDPSLVTMPAATTPAATGGERPTADANVDSVVQPSHSMPASSSLPCPPPCVLPSVRSQSAASTSLSATCLPRRQCLDQRAARAPQHICFSSTGATTSSKRMYFLHQQLVRCCISLTLPPAR